MNTKKNKKAGFTLVELMVVAIIVAILAAVAIPLMSGNKLRAMGTEAEAGLGSMVTILRVYKAENDVYPTRAAGSAASSLNGIDADDMDGQYFDTVNYTLTSADATYEVKCVGVATSGRGDTEGDSAGMSVTLDQDGTWTRSY